LQAPVRALTSGVTTSGVPAGSGTVVLFGPECTYAASEDDAADAAVDASNNTAPINSKDTALLHGARNP
jgi:hypothetical protein